MGLEKKLLTVSLKLVLLFQFYVFVYQKVLFHYFFPMLYVYLSCCLLLCHDCRIHDTWYSCHDTWYMIHDTNVMIHDTVVMIQWGFDYGCSTDRKFWLIDFNFFQNKMAMESCAPGLDYFLYERISWKLRILTENRKFF